MASSTAPITSSRDTPDTTASRIYFSTPSAQVRVPVGDLVFPPPLLLISRAGAGEPKIRKKNLKVPKTVAQCRKYPILYLYTLSRTIPYLYTLNRTIPYLNTLSRTIPSLNTLRKNPNLTQNQILVGSQSESSTKNLVSQSESSITAPKKPRTISARVEDPSRGWARVGSL